MIDLKVKFVFDKDVDEELNNKLIQILSTCFNDQLVFTKQRFYKEMPSLRWYYEMDNIISAHVALHEKKISTEHGDILIGGISEVCVHPLFRGKGFAKKLLEEANLYSKKMKHKFSMLYGDTNVYKSSGYKEIHNDIKYMDHITNEERIEKAQDAMVKKLSDLEWPLGLIDLNGPTF